MPAWHQLVPVSGHVEESETAKNCIYARFPCSKFILLLVNSTITIALHYVIKCSSFRASVPRHAGVRKDTVPKMGVQGPIDLWCRMLQYAYELTSTMFDVTFYSVYLYGRGTPCCGGLILFPYTSVLRPLFL